jgi:PEP-CTERM motif
VNWADNMGLYSEPQPPFVPQSPPNRVLFNLGPFGVGESVVTFIGGPQVFDGAYFAGFNDVQFNLYSGATLVATSSILILGDFGSGGSGPTFLASGYASPVDKVGIVGNRGFLTMDNFTYESVPEPSTFGLIAIGASVLGLRPRQRVITKRCHLLVREYNQ